MLRGSKSNFTQFLMAFYWPGELRQMQDFGGGFSTDVNNGNGGGPSSISAGAMVGIILGSVAVFVAILIGIIYCVTRANRKNAQSIRNPAFRA